MALADDMLGLAPETQALRRAGSGQIRGRNLFAADRFIRRLKALEIWQKLDVLWVLRAPNQTMAVVNWKNPGTFTLTEVNSPTFDKGGYTSNGTTSYLNTGWNASTNGVNYTLNDCAFGTYANGGSDAAANTLQVGARSAGFANQIWLRAWVATVFASAVNTDNDITVTSTTQFGFNVCQRTSSTANEIFRNGVSVGTGSLASTAIPNANMFICAGNDSSAVEMLSTVRISLAWFGASLTASQHAGFSAAWDAYMQGSDPV